MLGVLAVGVLEFVKSKGGRATWSEICMNFPDRTVHAMSQCLTRLVNKGELSRPAYATYELVENPSSLLRNAHRVKRRRDRGHVQPTLPIEAQPTYPEHAKLYATSQQDWAIREFALFACERGLLDWDFEQICDLLLEFRGVNRAAYEVESQDMRTKYKWLYEQYRNGERDQRPQELKPLPPEVVKRLESTSSAAEDALLATIRRMRS